MKNIKDYLFKSKKTFAKGLSKEKMFFVFIIFSFLGCLYEDTLSIVINYLNTGVFKYVTKRGLLYFELSPIYGWGACLMIYVLLRKKRPKHQYFTIGALLGGTFEYLISFLQETFTGTTSWNYSTYFLNINGRTTIPFMLFWGLLCYLCVTKVYPYVSKHIERIPYNLGQILYHILVIIIGLDMFISFSACIRLGLRHHDIPPFTSYGQFLDKHYNDTRMYKSYTNMEVTK